MRVDGRYPRLVCFSICLSVSVCCSLHFSFGFVHGRQGDAMIRLADRSKGRSATRMCVWAVGDVRVCVCVCVCVRCFDRSTLVIMSLFPSLPPIFHCCRVACCACKSARGGICLPRTNLCLGAARVILMLSPGCAISCNCDGPFFWGGGGERHVKLFAAMRKRICVCACVRVCGC